MSTLTIDLPDELAARLAQASEREHVPPAQIVRDALARALPTTPDAPGAGRFDAEAHRAWLQRTWGGRVFSEAEVQGMRIAQDRIPGA